MLHGSTEISMLNGTVFEAYMAKLILTRYGFVSVQLFCRAVQNALLLT